MKEAIVHPGPKVQIVDSDIPKPQAGEVLIKVVVSGSNPKDWKYPESSNRSFNTGDDIAGIVEAVGAKVIEFKPGERVAALHQVPAPHGSYAEYAIALADLTFRIPESISFEEAATVPLTAMTAAVALYQDLDLPEPWKAAKTTKPLPLIVYGAATAVGSFAIKLAQASNIHPIIAVASNISYVETLIDRSKGDAIVNYRHGDEAVVSGIKDALKNAGLSEVTHAFDAVSEHNSYTNISKTLSNGGHISLVLEPEEKLPDYITANRISLGLAFATGMDPESLKAKSLRVFSFLFTRYFGRALGDGSLTPHPYEVVPGGLNGVELGLSNLKAGKASAVKYVFRIEDTKISTD